MQDFFDIIHSIHCLERGHVWRKKTKFQVGLRYSCIPIDAISFFIDHCDICMLNKRQNLMPTLKPIRSNYSLERFQIDLIDMRHDPSDHWCWIARMIDDRAVKYQIVDKVDSQSGFSFKFDSFNVTATEIVTAVRKCCRYICRHFLLYCPFIN